MPRNGNSIKCEWCERDGTRLIAIKRPRKASVIVHACEEHACRPLEIQTTDQPRVIAEQGTLF